MREPSFWWTKPEAAAWLLSPLGLIYGAVAGPLMRRSGERIGIPVLCIGNFTLGGVGKTPTAITAATILSAAGERPFFLSRGYGGSLKGPVRVDPARHRADAVGDEPLLLARTAPTIVSHDRLAGARMAKAGGATVVVMDDGLQNPALHKDLTIAVIDARRGIGNGFVFPAGPLRAPLAAQLARTDAVLVVGTSARVPELEKRMQRRPFFHGTLQPEPEALRALAGRKVLAFAGIGNPEKFFTTLTAAGIAVRGTESFDDHHRYTGADAEALRKRATMEGLQLVTTEKDLVRMTGDPALKALMAEASALPVKLVAADQSAFRALLLKVVKKS